MYGLCLPTGEVYINEEKKENSCMIADFNNYDDFKEECEYLFENIGVDKIIYKDKYRYYEILREELENE